MSYTFFKYTISISFSVLVIIICSSNSLFAQQKWVNVDTAFAPLPKDFHVYKTIDSLDGKPFVAYYAEARLKDKRLNFTTDTTNGRRITPAAFYQKNDQPLLVVNTGFFSYETNKSLNLVMKDGQLLFYNTHTIPMKGKDTFQYKHPFGSAIGITKKGDADVAWVYADSSWPHPYAIQYPEIAIKDSISGFDIKRASDYFYPPGEEHLFMKFGEWKVKVAIGGGPVLVQNGEIKITNEEELRFNGKAINDMHPRTCMGYTADSRLIVMVIQGRFKDIADGASLSQEAKLLKDLGCVEALNLDGGGSSCMLINGKETIKPSSEGVQRPVPAVFIIKEK